MLYVVSYDITDDGRRLAVAKTLLDYGQRVHYSVFECLMDEGLLAELLGRLEGSIEDDEDSIRIYTICARCEKETRIIGKGVVVRDPEVYIL